MNINQLQGFTVTTSSDELVREFKRNAFSSGHDHDAFVFEQKTRTGEVKHRFVIMKSSAELALRAALQTQQERPGLVSVELHRFSPVGEMEFNPYF
jgi:hypothetical protein